MEQDPIRAFAARLAREAFNAGLRAARQPMAEQNRARTAMETHTQDMLVSVLDDAAARLSKALAS